MDDPSDLESLVSRELRRAIALDGRSLNAVGKAAGFSQGYLSQLLRGRQDLKLQHVVRVLATLQLQPSQFLRKIVDALDKPRHGSAKRDKGFSSASQLPQESLEAVIREAVRQELHSERLAHIVREQVEAASLKPLQSGATDYRPERGRKVDKVEDSTVYSRPHPGFERPQIDPERDEAQQRVSELLDLEPEKRVEKVVQTQKRYRGRLLSLLLLEEARAAIPDNPAGSASLAEVALAVWERTAPPPPDPDEVKVPALAVLGNARRALGQLRDAEEILGAARDLLHASDITDVRVAAELDRYQASLRKHQGRLGEAARLAARAAALYQFAGDLENAGRTLITLGTVHHRRRDWAAAIDASKLAAQVLHSASPKNHVLLAFARYNVAHYLHASGEVDRAEDELEANADLLASAGGWVTLHVVWLRARIAWNREDLVEAERLFVEARERSIVRGVAFDTSLISLELALVHLVQGRTREVERLATEALAVFAEQEVERETLAALELVAAAARSEALTREMVERAVSTLRDAPAGRAS